MHKNSSYFWFNVTDMSQEKINIFYTISILDKVFYYEEFVTIPLGIIGNLISIYIFTRPSLNKKTNTGRLFTILCIINIILIFYKAIFHWTFIYKFISNLKIHFNMDKFLKKVLEHSLSWIQALTSFDRFITVFYPVNGTRIMNKKWVLFSIIFGLLIFITCLNSFQFVLNSLNYSKNLLYLIYFFMDILIRILFPYLIILIFDVMVIVRLRRSNPEFRSRQPRRNKSSRFTINTIIIDFLFLVCNFPFIFDFFTYLIFNLFDPNSMLAKSIFDIFLYIYSHLFFILFVVFNRIFRDEFISILKCNSCLTNNVS